MPAWAPPPLPPRWDGREAGPALVGRRRELELLDLAWEETLRGCRQVLFVGGEPGSGKSRLAREVARTLHRQGAAVLPGSCPAGLGGPYEPFVVPIEALHAGLADDAASLGVDRARAGVLLDRLGAVLGRGGRRRSSAGPAAEARELDDAVVEVVRAAASRLPVVLVLEDLHLAGPVALQLLGHLVRRSAGSRLLVLGTLRTTAADRSEPLVEAISSLYVLAGVRRVDLAGLDTEAVAEYLLAEGVRGSAARSGAVLLREVTGGNPLVLREVWRDLSARGGLSGLRAGGSRVPASGPSRSDREDGLTCRELEVLALVGEGCSNRTIASRLHISENTTAHHVRSILLKTGSENRTQAAVYRRDRVR